MFNAITSSTQYTLEQNVVEGSHSLALGSAEILEPVVKDAIDAIVSRMAPTYLELMQEAKKNPEMISDYKSSLLDYYKNISLSSEIEMNLLQAQELASDCNVVTKMLSPAKRISVFLEKNKEFNENQAISEARFYIKLRIEAKDVKEEDPLDQLLAQLKQKMLFHGCGDEGTFDVRLEKGHLSLESSPWKWHFDGEIFKSSITVCYSNKKNWSTRISDSILRLNGRAADHGFFYDALKVYHRAPLPFDLEGQELSADDYRLFIRYNESYTEVKRPFPDTAEKEEGKIPFLPFNYKPIEKTPKLEFLRIKKLDSSLSNSSAPKYADDLIGSKAIKDIFGRNSEPRPPLTPVEIPEYHFSNAFAEFKTHNSNELDPNAFFIKEDDLLSIPSKEKDVQDQEKNEHVECILV